MTKKKVTQVETKVSDETLEALQKDKKVFKPTQESKKKATTKRVIAFALWFVAIALEIVAIFQLKKSPINMILILSLIGVDALFAIGGSMLWKQANRLDPASDKNKAKFFIQNQLGMIISIIAFLPLIVLLLLNEDLDNKEKGLVTAVAVVALALTSVLGFDFNPVSIEKYTNEISVVETLMGENAPVYWTKSGRVYHLYDDCHHINRDATTEIFKGTVPQAYEDKHIEALCKTCEARAKKNKDALEAENDEAYIIITEAIIQ